MQTSSRCGFSGVVGLVGFVGFVELVELVELIGLIGLVGLVGLVELVEPCNSLFDILLCNLFILALLGIFLWIVGWKPAGSTCNVNFTL